MISQLKVKNYRSLADVTVSFEVLTVLVGLNGSGKSNLVDVLRFVSEALTHGLDSAVIKRHGMSALRRWSGKGRPYDVEIGLEVTVGDIAAKYAFTLGSQLRGEYRITSESFSMLPKENYSGLTGSYSISDGEWIAPPNGAQPEIQRTALMLPLLAGLSPYREAYAVLTGMSFYDFLPDELAEPQRDANRYPLDDRGSNLATVLRELKQTNESASTGLQQALWRATGDVQDYRIERVGRYLVTRLRHANGQAEPGPLFDLSQESDGTLRILAILAALYQEPPRALIAIEEPELTIHPGALAVLWEEIAGITQRDGRQTQIILTTHSPDLLDMCEADQIRVVEKINGLTHVGPVAEEQKQIIQQKLFAPGQLLQAQGLRRAGAA